MKNGSVISHVFYFVQAHVTCRFSNIFYHFHVYGLFSAPVSLSHIYAAFYVAVELVSNLIYL